MPDEKKQNPPQEEKSIDDILKDLGLGGGDAVSNASGNISDTSVDDLLKMTESSDQPPSPGSQQTAPSTGAPFRFENFGSSGSASPETNINMLMDVALNVRIELGRCKMRVKDILNLGRGSVVELDKLAGDPLDILVNDQLVAKGEILVLGDETFCIRITEVMAKKEKAK